MAVLRRYDIDSLDNRDPALIGRLVALIERVLVPYHRAEVRGVERIPAGAALYVGNHNSGYSLDTFIFAAAAYRAHGVAAVPYGLGHELAVRLPILHQLLVPLGAVRASPGNGERLLGAGHKVLVYPGGDLDAGRPFRLRDRVVFGGRRGFMRLALRASVPVVPVVAAGAHATLVVIDDMRWVARALGIDRALRLKVWPLVLSAPWGLTLGPPPVYLPLPSRILVEVLEPMRFERSGPRAADDAAYVERCAARVERTMQRALDRLAADRAGRRDTGD